MSARKPAVFTEMMKQHSGCHQGCHMSGSGNPTWLAGTSTIYRGEHPSMWAARGRFRPVAGEPK